MVGPSVGRGLEDAGWGNTRLEQFCGGSWGSPCISPNFDPGMVCTAVCQDYICASSK